METRMIKRTKRNLVLEEGEEETVMTPPTPTYPL
jgi:hypothetical protein